MKRIYELDGLRAIAVAAVITDHYAPFRTMADGLPTTLGSFGVDVFFVLSGYLITRILLGLRSSTDAYRVFYARRSLRILPPYVLLLLLVYGTGALLNQANSLPKLLGHAFFLQGFKGTGLVLARLRDLFTGRSPIPGLFDRVGHYSISRDYPNLPFTGSLGPTWSLSVEEWFYVLWAPVVLLLRRRFIGAIAIGACTMGFFIRWLTGNHATFLSTVDVLVSGALVALWLEYRATRFVADQLLIDRIVGTVALVSFCLLMILTALHRDRMAGSLLEIALLGGISWIVQNSGRPHLAMTALRCRVFVYLGSISYMAYLMHLPMYFAVRSLSARFLRMAPMDIQLWTVAVASIIATLLFAAISWNYFEGPIMGLKDRITDSLSADRPRNRRPVIVEG
jgi:peptidoglycan/LPS O-acetylase OafA/YrhL